MSVASTRAEARAFARRYGWRFPSILDPRRERARRLGAEYQPVVIVLDKREKIVARHVGAGNKRIWARLAPRR